MQIGQRHIDDAHQTLLAHLAANRVLVELLEELFAAGRSHRAHHPAARLQLVEQLQRHNGRSGADMDGIVRRLRGMSETAVALWLETNTVIP